VDAALKKAAAPSDSFNDVYVVVRRGPMYFEAGVWRGFSTKELAEQFIHTLGEFAHRDLAVFRVSANQNAVLVDVGRED
jgi:hypothetical protein